MKQCAKYFVLIVNYATKNGRIGRARSRASCPSSVISTKIYLP